MASYGGSQQNGCQFNGILPNKEESWTSGLDKEIWMRAEESAAELIAHIQPDEQSWKKRSAIISYLQRLITQCIGCLVFPYGSVPLRTYLPDGDIDLTVFSQNQHLYANFAAEVYSMLINEKKNEYAEYPIKDVHFINAKVKVLKCTVDNIVVDISFGQLSGLCALCFLEQVDQHIQQDHLFKRSIILIKSWCYYDSRLMGADHALLSTYALETLVLYIFHVFNNSFGGPLEVLFRFLEFFSDFDWDTFCISLQGPVPIKSLPNMTAIHPRKDGGSVFLSSIFLDTCSSFYSVCPSTPEIRDKFVYKFINIIDFTCTNNNLGRSVSRGNFRRIRSAFSVGAERLAKVMKGSEENVATELHQFFFNSWKVDGKTLKVSSGNSKDGLHVTSGDELEERLCADVVFEQSSHMVNGLDNGIPFSISETEVQYNLHREGKGPLLNTPDSVNGPDYEILSGELANHLNNMLYARCCQKSPLNVPLFCRPTIAPSQYLGQQFMPGNSGRLSSSAVNYAVVPEYPVIPSSLNQAHEASLAGGYQRYGRGAHVQNLGSYWDSNSSSSRNQKENHHHYRIEQHRERTVHSNFNSRPRFAGHSCPRDHPNSRPGCSASTDDRGHMQWKALRHQPSFPDQPVFRRVESPSIM